jgi:hypothetical protein
MLVWLDLRTLKTLWPGSGLALGLLLAVAPARAQDAVPPAEDYTLRVEYRWWSPTPEGEIQKGLGPLEGTVLDVQQDLAVESGGGHTFRGAFRLGEAWKLRGGWVPLDFEGDVQTLRPFTYGTLVARPGDQIITALRGDAITVGLEWDFLRGPAGFLGATGGVKYFGVDTLMLNASTSGRVAESWQLPMPFVGLAGGVYFGGWFSLELELGGMTLGSRGHLWEWLVGLRVHPADWIAVAGGYDKLSLEGQDDRDYFNLRLGAWTFGVEISL